MQKTLPYRKKIVQIIPRKTSKSATLQLQKTRRKHKVCGGLMRTDDAYFDSVAFVDEVPTFFSTPSSVFAKLAADDDPTCLSMAFPSEARNCTCGMPFTPNSLAALSLE